MNATNKPSVNISSEFINRKRSERLASISKSRIKLFKRVYTGRAAPRNAIKAFCYDCLDFNEQEIRTCTVPSCPLYEYRPYQ